MAKRGIWEIFGRKASPVEADERPPDPEPNLHHYIPPVFESTLRGLLGEGARPLAVLFVPSSQILGWTPGRALVLLSDGVLCMEEGESVILDQKWGVKTRFYPYGQIAGLELGNALLRGRFTVLGAGSAPAFQFDLHWRDLYNFRAAARLIRQKMGQAARREDHAHPDHLGYPRQLDGASGRRGGGYGHRPHRVSG